MESPPTLPSGVTPAARRAPLRHAAALLVLTLTPSFASAAIRGDVNLDETVDAADATVLLGYLEGELFLDDEAFDAADVAPLVGASIAPDNQVDLGDLVVLLRVFNGEAILPPAPDAPALDPVPAATNSNPFLITGTADPSASLFVYVNDQLSKDADCNFTVDDQFQCDVVALFDGSNTIRVVAEVEPATSPSSNAVSISYTDLSSRGGFTSSECNPFPCDPTSISEEFGTIVVWTPGPGAGQPYKISSLFAIPENAMLIILPRTQIEFDTNDGLNVVGKLLVRGRASTSADPDENRVRFKPKTGVTGEGKWEGIRIASTGNVIEFARIDDSETAVDIVDNARADVSDSIIRRFSREGIALAPNGRGKFLRNVIDDLNRTQPGIELQSANSAQTQIHDNEIRNCSRGIQLSGTSPTIRGNLLESNGSGVELSGASSPAIEWNTVRGNCVGIWLRQGALGNPVPLPDVNENSIYGNVGNGEGNCSGTLTTNYVIEDGAQVVQVSNYPAGTVLNAENNWWGTSDPIAAAAGILDHTDRAAAPIVDFIPLLEAPHDSFPAPASIGDGQFLVGIANDTLMPLSPGDFDVVGSLVVPELNTWNVPGDVALSMLAGTGVEVFGTLSLLGSAGNEISLMSMEVSPGPGDWRGITIVGTNATATIDHAIIHHTETAVSVFQGHLDISNSDLEAFEFFGIEATDHASGSVVDNTIGPDSGSAPGVGIELTESNLDLLGNRVQNLGTGVRLTGVSSILIGRSTASGKGNTITGNTWGIDLKGDASGDPTPTINHNNLFGNINANLRTRGFSPGGSGVLDARSNWWGTTTVPGIRATIVHDAVNPILVDVSNYLDQADGSEIGGTAFSHLISNVGRSSDFITPTEATNQQLTLTFDTPAMVVADLTVQIYREEDDGLSVLLKTLSQDDQPGGPQTFIWDGTDSAGILVPPDAYIFRVLADDGLGQDEYNPPRGPTPVVTTAGSMLATDPIIPQQNRFWRALYSHEIVPARVRLEINPPAGSGSTFDAPGLTNLPFPTRNGNLLVYNGRAADGRSFIEGGGYISSIKAVAALKPNFVVVEKTNPQIRGPELVSPPPAVPNVEIRANPYRLRQSFDQITTLRFELDRAACVKIFILKPDFDPLNPTASVVATILDAELTAGTHEARWLDDPAHGLATSDGTHTFLVEASSKVGMACVTTLKTSYLGAIQVRK